MLTELPAASAEAVLSRQIPPPSGPTRIVLAGGQGTNWYVTRLSAAGAVEWTTTIPLPVGTVAAHVGGMTMDATGVLTIAGWGETSVGGAHGYLGQISVAGAQPAAPALTRSTARGRARHGCAASPPTEPSSRLSGSAKTGAVTKAYVGRRNAALGQVWESQRAIGSGGDATANDVQVVSGAGRGTRCRRRPGARRGRRAARWSPNTPRPTALPRSSG